MHESFLKRLALVISFGTPFFAFRTLAADYAVTDLGALGTTSAGHGLSDTGIATGVTAVGSETHAFRWQSGVMTDLGVLGPSHHYSSGVRVNNSGVIAGYSTSSPSQGSDYRAVRWTGNSASPLGSFGGGYSVARGVNNNGDVVGITGYANGVTHAFIWTAGVITDLNATAGANDFTDAFDINESRQVAGNNGDNVAFRWQSGVTQLLPPLAGYAGSYAYKINEAGHVVGESYTGGSNRPTLWTGNVPVTIGSDPGLAISINDADQVVGTNNTGPFIWDSVSGVRNLNGLIDPLAGWSVLHVNDINNLGQIIGTGTDTGGVAHAILLTPIPEANGIAIVGATMLAMRQRKRFVKTN